MQLSFQDENILKQVINNCNKVTKEFHLSSPDFSYEEMESLETEGYVQHLSQKYMENISGYITNKGLSYFH